MVSKIHRRSGNAVVQHCKILKWRPDTVWQVGVGLNHQEIDCLLEEWPEIQMIGFEPHPKIFGKIQNEFPGTLYNMAVSDSPKTVTLYGKPRHKDGSSIFPYVKEEDNQNTFEGIQAVHLDHPMFDWLKRSSQSESSVSSQSNQGSSSSSGPTNRVLLWLDCEGGEMDVLDGARNFIKTVQAVNVEMTGAPVGKGWCDPEEVHNQLHEDGFFLQITHTNRPSAGQFDGLYVRGNIFNPGYCNCPMEITRHRRWQQ